MQKRSAKITKISIMTLLLYALHLFDASVALAKTVGERSILLVCSVDGCKYPRRSQDATHIAFTIKKGSTLLYEIQARRTIEKEKQDLQDRKIQLKKQELSLYIYQLEQSQRTVKVHEQQIALLRKANRDLTRENQQAAAESAKYKGERFRFMIYGFTIGAGVVLAGGIAVGVFLATR